MRINAEEFVKSQRDIESGFNYAGQIIGQALRWVEDTKYFIFGHNNIRMTHARECDKNRPTLILSQEDLTKENMDNTPHVCLMFENESGLDALIRELEKLRPVIRGDE